MTCQTLWGHVAGRDTARHDLTGLPVHGGRWALSKLFCGCLFNLGDPCVSQASLNCMHTGPWGSC